MKQVKIAGKWYEVSSYVLGAGKVVIKVDDGFVLRNIDEIESIREQVWVERVEMDKEMLVLSFSTTDAERLRWLLARVFGDAKAGVDLAKYGFVTFKDMTNEQAAQWCNAQIARIVHAFAALPIAEA
jgi:hypothetical protein